MNSKWCKFFVFTAKVTRVTLWCKVFLTCSYPSHLKHLVLGRLPARNALKTRCFSWEVHEKVQKTSSDSSGGTGRLWRSGLALGGSGGDFRCCVLRTVAQNLSKVSQMHPENMQEHLFRCSTLCSAHSSPELVKSIPNAPRQYASTVFVRFSTLCSAHSIPELVNSIPNAPRKYAIFCF